MTTVYPFNFHLGPLNVTGYGIMLMVGFLVGGWLHSGNPGQCGRPTKLLLGCGHVGRG